MFRLAVLISFALVLCILPGGYAGPACTKKYYKTAQCVQKCQTRWGYPGTMMGTNRWGVVMQHVDDDSKDGWKAVIEEACGMSSKSKESEESSDDDDDDDDDPGVAGAVGSNPDDDVTTILATTSELFSFATSSSLSSSSTSTTKSTKTPHPTPAALQATPTPKTSTTSHTTEKETPAPKPTPKPTPQPDKHDDDSDDDDDGDGESGDDDSGSSNQGGDIGEYLAGHNNFRKLHGAAPLTWNDNLASKAQQWANKCQFKHSGGSLGPFGENLAAGTGSSYGIPSAIKSWTDESKDYDPNNPAASHFTQVVWKSSKQVGCALQMCDGIFDPKFGKAKFVVCEYDPPGNFNNEFAQNVQV